MMVVPSNATAAAAASGVTAVLAQLVTDDWDEDMLDAGFTKVEGKLNPSDFGLGLSQAIATAITFSFVYKTHYSYDGTPFPTVQVSSHGFEIFLYDRCSSHEHILIHGHAKLGCTALPVAANQNYFIIRKLQL